MALSLDNLNFEQEGFKIKQLLNAAGSFPVKDAEKFIISKSWWDQWELYVSEPDNPLPGFIDSSDILLNPDETPFIRSALKPNHYTNFILKPGLKCDVDYVIVTPTIWRLFTGKYQVRPGSIIRRYGI
jgi:hypothetical protein